MVRCRGGAPRAWTIDPIADEEDVAGQTSIVGRVFVRARARFLARFLFPVDWEASLQVLPPAPRNTRYALSVAPEARSVFITAATSRRERASERQRERDRSNRSSCRFLVLVWYGS
jgi:hypothetical protein